MNTLDASICFLQSEALAHENLILEQQMSWHDETLNQAWKELETAISYQRHLDHLDDLDKYEPIWDRK